MKDIRMIKIEISEIKRKIEVARKTVSVVPGLADNVIQLKAELNREKEKEKEISEALGILSNAICYICFRKSRK